MRKGLLAIVGIILLVVGIGYNLFYTRSRSIAKTLDRFIEPGLPFPTFFSSTERLPQPLALPPVEEAVPDCLANDIDASIEVDKRFLSKHETVLLTVTVSRKNPAESENESSEPTVGICRTSINLRSGKFETQWGNRQSVQIAPGEGETLIWQLFPQEIGSSKIIVEGDAVGQSIKELKVNNLLGFTATQARAISIAGGIFGTLLTSPWLYDFLQKNRQKGG